MIEFNDAGINNLVLHRISADPGKCFVSDELYNYNNAEDIDTLKKIFLKPFVAAASTYEFRNQIDLELNTLYKLSQAIFEGEDFLATSKNIHQHLKTVSKHPNIKDGDLFIIKYDDIQIKNKFYEGLGIYKIENKESFIETHSETGDMGLNFKKGISGRKLDKACLILFTETPYTILIIDNSSTEADYWKNDFITVDYKNDYINNTNQFLTMAKTFVTDQLPNEYEVSKTDQIDLLNRSVEYFKTRDTFVKTEFEDQVLQNPAMINSFRNFDGSYRQNNDMELADSFEISAEAVKKQARVFKSVLKLDKNFHIYIHGSRDLIEQGTEPDGRKYYKIYYKEEQ